MRARKIPVYYFLFPVQLRHVIVQYLPISSEISVVFGWNQDSVVTIDLTRIRRISWAKRRVPITSGGILQARIDSVGCFVYCQSIYSCLFDIVNPRLLVFLAITTRAAT